MEKKKFNWHGKTYYYLFTCNGENYYLESARFDCDWYWSIGYVEAFSNKRNPHLSKDIVEHRHFDSMFPTYKEFFSVMENSPFTDKEKWQIYEIMKSLYICRHYSDLLYAHGAHITTNPVADTISCPSEYNRINNRVIPELLSALYKILGGEE